MPVAVNCAVHTSAPVRAVPRLNAIAAARCHSCTTGKMNQTAVGLPDFLYQLNEWRPKQGDRSGNIVPTRWLVFRLFWLSQIAVDLNLTGEPGWRAVGQSSVRTTQDVFLFPCLDDLFLLRPRVVCLLQL